MRERAIAVAVAIGLLSMASALRAAEGGAGQLLVEVAINGEVKSRVELVELIDGEFALPRSRWIEFGVVLPASASSEVVTAQQLGVTYQFDASSQSYSLTVPAQLLQVQYISYGPQMDKAISPSPKGVLLGYDVAVLRDRQTHQSLAHDLRANVLSGTFHYGAQLNSVAGRSNYRRSMTTWNKDIFSRNIVVTVGDVVSSGGNVNLMPLLPLGGIRVGSDRRLAGDSFYPAPVLGGVLDTRSTAEIYVNNQRRKLELEAGPYRLANLGYFSGLNEVDLVVTDMFGRQSTTRQSLYASPNSFSRGQTEWELAVGKVRSNNAGDSYGDPIISGAYATGLSDRWTLTTAGRVTAEGSTVMVGNLFNLGRGGIVSVDVARQGKEGAFGIGYERRLQRWGITASHARMSEGFYLPYGGSERFKPRSISQLSLSANNRGKFGSLSYARVEYGSRVSESLSMRGQARLPGRVGDISVSLSRDFQTRDTAVMVGWRREFGGVRAGVAARVQQELLVDAQAQGEVYASGQPIQWNAASYALPDQRRTTTVSARADLPFVETRLDVYQGARSAVRFGGRGSVWLGQGGTQLAQKSHGAYALISVPKQAGVQLNFGGRVLAANRSGVLLVPNIVPLFPYSVTVNGTTVAAGTELESYVQKAVAPRGGGALVRFAVEAQTVRMFRLVIDGVPVRDAVSVEVAGATYAVGRTGIFSVPDAAKGMRGAVTRADGRCVTTMFEVTSDPFETMDLDCDESK